MRLQSALLAVCAAGLVTGVRGRRSRLSQRLRTITCSRFRKGTWARRMAGNKVEILPSRINLTLGLRDILVLRNQRRRAADFRPHADHAGADVSGLRLSRAGLPSISLLCTASRERASGQMTIVVEPNPSTHAWARIRLAARARYCTDWGPPQQITPKMQTHPPAHGPNQGLPPCRSPSRPCWWPPGGPLLAQRRA